MLFYNLLNMNNFTFKNFSFNSEGFTTPNLGLNNYRTFNNTNVTFNNNFGWNSYFPPIGDTFVSSNTNSFNTQPNYNFNYSYTPTYAINTTINYTPSTYFAPLPSSGRTTGSSTVSRNPSLVDYKSLTRSEALNAAKRDPYLERLMTTVSDKGYTITINEDVDFINDIPYARKGTMDVLLAAADRVGRNLRVTSALGSKTSPHSGSSTGNSHYNPNNPKIDFGGGMSHDTAKALKRDLESTGLFNFVNIEYDGDTAHLDAQIKMSAYDKYA